MTTRAPTPARTVLPALGTTAALLVTDPSARPIATAVLRAELTNVDLRCGRFRPDSELTRVNLGAGTSMTVSAYFAEALQVALRAARTTDGAVDPTVGRAVIALGYDCTFASVLPDDARPLAADRTARRTAAATGSGVLVSLGGDLTTAGPAPEDGWRIALADDHARPATEPGPTVAVTGGALATSGIRVRTWRRDGRTLHHIVAPATGEPATPVWRTVTVAAATCVDANTAGTAAIVLGDRALDWLRDTALPVRLIGLDGDVVRLGGRPPDSHVPAQGGAR
ncbi:FAD:protein FMN transferase [Streptomyces sp. NPDC051172]|uniref:FAD:protein FMN transferase n=1 Tax=Streptomyces sp. NPDC051172 TaxID=3155796 RepID=UPI00341BD246